MKGAGNRGAPAGVGRRIGRNKQHGFLYIWLRMVGNLEVMPLENLNWCEIPNALIGGYR
jgi:hypothetical protein